MLSLRHLALSLSALRALMHRQEVSKRPENRTSTLQMIIYMYIYIYHPIFVVMDVVWPINISVKV